MPQTHEGAKPSQPEPNPRCWAHRRPAAPNPPLGIRMMVGSPNEARAAASDQQWEP